MTVSRSARLLIVTWILVFVTLVLDNLVGTKYPSPQNAALSIVYLTCIAMFFLSLALFIRDHRRTKKTPERHNGDTQGATP